MGSNQYVNKDVNLAALQVVYLDVFVDIWSISPLTLNIQMNIQNVNRNMVFLCIRLCLFILYYALLFQTFEHVLLNNMHCYHYYTVS